MTRTFLLTLVASLAACDGTGNGSGTSYSSYDGEERWMYGYSQGSDLSCDMYWTVAGTPATTATCRECTFTFELEFTYDAESSTEDGSCTELAVDFDQIYAYQAVPGDRYDYSGTVATGYLGTIYDGYFVYLGLANLDGSTGTFTYTWGVEESLYYYEGAYGYYTDFHVGSATLQ